MSANDNYNFETMLNELGVGMYFYKFDTSTLPSWASELTSYCQIVVSTQGVQNWIFDIKMATADNPVHYRIVYARSNSTIKFVSKYSLTNISTT